MFVPDDFHAYSTKFGLQLRQKFQATRSTAQKRSQAAGLGTRSSTAVDYLVDDEAYKVETTNIKRLSRLHVEDVIQCREGTPIVLYVEKGNQVLRDMFDGVTDAASTLQLKRSRRLAKAKGGNGEASQAGETIRWMIPTRYRNDWDTTDLCQKMFGSMVVRSWKRMM